MGIEHRKGKFTNYGIISNYEEKPKEQTVNGDPVSIKRDTNQNHIILWISFFAFMFFLVAVFLNKSLGFGLSDESAMITFIGIIATFIVVGNYSQIRDIKEEFKKREEEIEHLKRESAKLQKDIARIYGMLYFINPKGVISTKIKRKKDKES